MKRLSLNLKHYIQRIKTVYNRINQYSYKSLICCIFRQIIPHVTNAIPFDITVAQL